jgi:PPM family protein phosphatase
MELVNKEIYNYTRENEKFIRMATTMVAAVVRGNQLTVANVGDSRTYLIRKGDVTQITRDHSLVSELVASGSMTQNEAQNSSVKNRLTRSIGGQPEVQVDVYSSISLQIGDCILLCSDGLTRYAQREKIGELTSEGSPQEIAQRLVGYANHQGGADNVSVILVSIQPETQEQQPAVPIPQRPLSPDWETMETEPGIRTRNIQKQTVSVTSGGWMRWAALGAGLLLLASITGYGVFGWLSTPQISTQIPIASINLSEVASPIPALSTEAIQPTFTQTIPATETPTFTETSLPSPTASMTPTVEVSATADLSAHAECKYTLQKGDYLAKVAEIFGIGSNHYNEIVCAPESTASGCDLSNSSNVQPGWIVIIPNVLIKTCLAQEGIVNTTP